MIGARILVMVCVRIAVVVIAILLPVELSSVDLCAQPAPQGNVAIQVTTFAGALIHGAQIGIGSGPSDIQIVAKTDGNGKASFDIAPGNYVLSVTTSAFEPWTREIDVRSGASQIVHATLELTTYGDPMIFSGVDDIPLHEPEPAFIPAQPLLNFGPLPIRSAKRRW